MLPCYVMARNVTLPCYGEERDVTMLGRGT